MRIVSIVAALAAATTLTACFEKEVTDQQRAEFGKCVVEQAKLPADAKVTDIVGTVGNVKSFNVKDSNGTTVFTMLSTADAVNGGIDVTMTDEGRNLFSKYVTDNKPKDDKTGAKAMEIATKAPYRGDQVGLIGIAVTPKSGSCTLG